MKSKISATQNDGEDEPDGCVHGQACLMKMDSSTLATSSA